MKKAEERMTLAFKRNNNIAQYSKMLQNQVNQLGFGSPGINFFNLHDRNWNDKNGHVKHFKLGDFDITVENIDNKFFKMASIQFNITTDGQVNVSWGGTDKQYATLEELRAEINHYKQMYKEIKAFGAKLQAEKDFI